MSHVPPCHTDLPGQLSTYAFPHPSLLLWSASSITGGLRGLPGHGPAVVVAQMHGMGVDVVRSCASESESESSLSLAMCEVAVVRGCVAL
jgi:hypothetical protein